MQLEERVVGDVIVLAPTGRMTRDVSFGVVRHRLADLVKEGKRKLVLDLAAVSYMDSTCVGELVSGLVMPSSRTIISLTSDAITSRFPSKAATSFGIRSFLVATNVEKGAVWA